METSTLGSKSVAISECTVVILYQSQTNQTQEGAVIIHDIIASLCWNLDGGAWPPIFCMYIFLAYRKETSSKGNHDRCAITES